VIGAAAELDVVVAIAPRPSWPSRGGSAQRVALAPAELAAAGGVALWLCPAVYPIAA
jgi:hypothetical protein